MPDPDPDPQDLYIERQADRIIYDKLQDGDCCYIVSPPQTGKTLLLRNVKSKLEATGFKCAVIDLKTNLDRNITNDEEGWNWKFIDNLAKQLTLSNGNGSSNILTRMV
jgi:hypothetical protein